jgi:tetratricopeptide (TPR) repeat protein
MPTDSANTPATTANAEDAYYAAVDCVAEGQWDKAIAAFRKALRLDPHFLDAMHGLVRALQNAGQLDEAIATAQRLIARDPDDVLAHTSLSILFQNKGMIPEAEAEATRAKVLGWKQQLKTAHSKPE